MHSIDQTIDKIFSTRRITRYDQHLLMTLFSQGDISDSDKALINRVYEALTQGQLKVVE
ncbi:MAG: hypothetical protein QNJ46_22265 [Leptolyngbyaceae cyanobacterium MO_188.B28]|nr:hypothetical protein [Leptolyngbyaceae cyanobacterium MO_188.B28]